MTSHKTDEVNWTPAFMEEFAMEWLKHDILLPNHKTTMSKSGLKILKCKKRREMYAMLGLSQYRNWSHIFLCKYKALLTKILARAWDREWEQFREHPRNTEEIFREALPAWMICFEEHFHVTDKVQEEIRSRRSRVNTAFESLKLLTAVLRAVWGSRRSIPANQGGAQTGAQERLMWENAVDSAAVQCGLAPEIVHSTWNNLKKVSMQKLRLLQTAGDQGGGVRAGVGMRGADWLVADLLLLYDDSKRLLKQYSLRDNEQVSALTVLATLVHCYGLSEWLLTIGDLGLKWLYLTHAYNYSGRLSSTVVLQRRWWELVTLTRGALSAARTDPCPVPPICRQIAHRFPKLLTEPVLSWRVLVDSGSVYAHDYSESEAPNWSELGPPPPPLFLSDYNPENNEDDDLILIERDIETIDVDIDSDDEGKQDNALGRAIQSNMEIQKTLHDILKQDLSDYLDKDLKNTLKDIASHDDECNEKSDSTPLSDNLESTKMDQPEHTIKQEDNKDVKENDEHVSEHESTDLKETKENDPSKNDFTIDLTEEDSWDKVLAGVSPTTNSDQKVDKNNVMHRLVAEKNELKSDNNLTEDANNTNQNTSEVNNLNAKSLVFDGDVPTAFSSLTVFEQIDPSSFEAKIIFSDDDDDCNDSGSINTNIDDLVVDKEMDNQQYQKQAPNPVNMQSDILMDNVKDVSESLTSENNKIDINLDNLNNEVNVTESANIFIENKEKPITISEPSNNCIENKDKDELIALNKPKRPKIGPKSFMLKHKNENVKAIKKRIGPKSFMMSRDNVKNNEPKNIKSDTSVVDSSANIDDVASKSTLLCHERFAFESEATDKFQSLKNDSMELESDAAKGVDNNRSLTVPSKQRLSFEAEDTKTLQSAEKNSTSLETVSTTDVNKTGSPSASLEKSIKNTDTLKTDSTELASVAAIDVDKNSAKILSCGKRLSFETEDTKTLQTLEKESTKLESVSVNKNCSETLPCVKRFTFETEGTETTQSLEKDYKGLESNAALEGVKNNTQTLPCDKRLGFESEGTITLPSFGNKSTELEPVAVIDEDKSNTKPLSCDERSDSESQSAKTLIHEKDSTKLQSLTAIGVKRKNLETCKFDDSSDDEYAHLVIVEDNEQYDTKKENSVASNNVSSKHCLEKEISKDDNKKKKSSNLSEITEQNLNNSNSVSLLRFDQNNSANDIKPDVASQNKNVSNTPSNPTVDVKEESDLISDGPKFEMKIDEKGLNTDDNTKPVIDVSKHANEFNNDILNTNKNDSSGDSSNEFNDDIDDLKPSTDIEVLLKVISAEDENTPCEKKDSNKSVNDKTIAMETDEEILNTNGTITTELVIQLPNESDNIPKQMKTETEGPNTDKTVSVVVNLNKDSVTTTFDSEAAENNTTCEDTKEAISDEDVSSDMNKLVMDVQIPMYRIDDLWKGRANINSIDLTEVDSTIHTFEHAVRTGKSLPRTGPKRLECSVVVSRLPQHIMDAYLKRSQEQDEQEQDENNSIRARGKKVELSDIDEVRRINGQLATAQVKPLASGAQSSKSGSDSDSDCVVEEPEIERPTELVQTPEVDNTLTPHELQEVLEKLKNAPPRKKSNHCCPARRHISYNRARARMCARAGRNVNVVDIHSRQGPAHEALKCLCCCLSALREETRASVRLAASLKALQNDLKRLQPQPKRIPSAPQQPAQAPEPPVGDDSDSEDEPALVIDRDSQSQNTNKRKYEQQKKGRPKKKKTTDEEKDKAKENNDYAEWMRQRSVWNKYFTINPMSSSKKKNVPTPSTSTSTVTKVQLSDRSMPTNDKNDANLNTAPNSNAEAQNLNPQASKSNLQAQNLNAHAPNLNQQASNLNSPAPRLNVQVRTVQKVAKQKQQISARCAMGTELRQKYYIINPTNASKRVISVTMPQYDVSRTNSITNKQVVSSNDQLKLTADTNNTNLTAQSLNVQIPNLNEQVYLNTQAPNMSAQISNVNDPLPNLNTEGTDLNIQVPKPDKDALEEAPIQNLQPPKLEVEVPEQDTLNIDLNIKSETPRLTKEMLDLNELAHSSRDDMLPSIDPVADDESESDTEVTFIPEKKISIDLTDDDNDNSNADMTMVMAEHNYMKAAPVAIPQKHVPIPQKHVPMPISQNHLVKTNNPVIKIEKTPRSLAQFDTVRTLQPANLKLAKFPIRKMKCDRKIEKIPSNVNLNIVKKNNKVFIRPSDTSLPSVLVKPRTANDKAPKPTRLTNSILHKFGHKNQKVTVQQSKQKDIEDIAKNIVKQRLLNRDDLFTEVQRPGQNDNLVKSQHAISQSSVNLNQGQNVPVIQQLNQNYLINQVTAQPVIGNFNQPLLNVSQGPNPIVQVVQLSDQALSQNGSQNMMGNLNQPLLNLSQTHNVPMIQQINQIPQHTINQTLSAASTVGIFNQPLLNLNQSQNVIISNQNVNPIVSQQVIPPVLNQNQGLDITVIQEHDNAQKLDGTLSLIEHFDKNASRVQSDESKHHFVTQLAGEPEAKHLWNCAVNRPLLKSLIEVSQACPGLTLMRVLHSERDQKSLVATCVTSPENPNHSSIKIVTRTPNDPPPSPCIIVQSSIEKYLQSINNKNETLNQVNNVTDIKTEPHEDNQQSDTSNQNTTQIPSNKMLHISGMVQNNQPDLNIHNNGNTTPGLDASILIIDDNVERKCNENTIMPVIKVDPIQTASNDKKQLSNPSKVSTLKDLSMPLISNVISLQNAESSSKETSQKQERNVAETSETAKSPGCKVKSYPVKLFSDLFSSKRATLHAREFAKFSSKPSTDLELLRLDKSKPLWIILNQYLLVTSDADLDNKSPSYWSLRPRLDYTRIIFDDVKANEKSKLKVKAFANLPGTRNVLGSESGSKVEELDYVISADGQCYMKLPDPRSDYSYAQVYNVISSANMAERIMIGDSPLFLLNTRMRKKLMPLYRCRLANESVCSLFCKESPRAARALANMLNSFHKWGISQATDVTSYVVATEHNDVTKQFTKNSLPTVKPVPQSRGDVITLSDDEDED